MRNAFVSACVAAVFFAVVLHGSPAFAEYGSGYEFDEKVRKAIERGRDYLLSQWTDSGEIKSQWSGNDKYPTGATALAAYALLASGVNPQEAKMAKTLKWLQDNPSKMTYNVALRCNAWYLADKKTLNKYKNILRQEAWQLAQSLKDGAIRYKCTGYPEGGWDNSCSQLAVLGIWTAALGDLKVHSSTWKAIQKHWVSVQNDDGGWPYERGLSTSAMSASGVATLYILLDNLYASEFVGKKATASHHLIKRITAGLKWLDANFKNPPMGHSDYPYWIYAVERVGLASGYKNFGKLDWYKHVANRLLRQQNGGAWRGGWGDVVGTSFCMLFLVRGQHPVVFNKLEYAGSWSNRPRDMASLTRWLSKTFELTMNWQIVHIRNTRLADWHDAPILYIAGDEAPQFTDEDIDRLGKYVNQGGTILSVGEFGRKKFRDAMRENYKKLFPDYELVAAPSDHPIYTDKVYYNIDKNIKFWILSNGIRPLAIHTDFDLAKYWQAGAAGKKSLPYYRAGVNIIRYVTGTLTPRSLLKTTGLRHRAVSHWPDPDKGGGRTIRVARLKHGGNYDPEPLAYKRLAILMSKHAETNLEVSGPIAIGDLAGDGAKIASLTGTGTLQLTADEQTAIKNFVSGGGTLVVDAAGGDKEFAESAETLIEEMFQDRRQRLRQLALASNLYRLAGRRIEAVKFRPRTYARYKTKYPQLAAVLIGRRPGVIYSSLDLTAGLVGYLSFTVDGYHPDSAFELMRNILIYSNKQAGAAE